LATGRGVGSITIGTVHLTITPLPSCGESLV
jgi:hypothetical protein